MVFTLNAEPRSIMKKSDLTKLRASGMIPAVVYGAGVDTTKLSVQEVEFMKCYKNSFKQVTFYEVHLDGNKYHTILKDKQIHPVQRNFLHLDFLVLDPDSTMELEIPVNYIGEPAGLKDDGFMDVIQRSVKVMCKVTDIPEGLELDVSDMEIGDAKHIGDLPKGAWEFIDSDDNTLVVIHARAEEEEEPEEDEELEEGELEEGEVEEGEETEDTEEE